MHLTQVQLYNDHYPTDQFYPFDVPALRGTSKLVFRRPIVFFVGENGSGKSTLLEAITKRCGIHLWDKPKRHVVHNNPYETRLSDFVAVTWSDGSVPGSLFRAETFRDIADFLDDVALCDPGQLQYQGGHILNTLSHGESMLSYFSGRYDRKGLYLLDEPEAALSPASQVKFARMLSHFERAGNSQFIIATHSPILLALPGAQIFCFDGPQIREVSYHETQHYQIYKQFLSNPTGFLEQEPNAIAV